jgi:hypothetical protein
VTPHDMLATVKLTGTVKDGQIVFEGAPLPEGTPVTITVNERDLPPGPYILIDEHGEIIMTPELEADLEEARAQADRGEGTPWEVVRERLFRSRPR